VAAPFMLWRCSAACRGRWNYGKKKKKKTELDGAENEDRAGDKQSENGLVLFQYLLVLAANRESVGKRSSRHNTKR
jgi:hypothetical protein